MTTKKADLLALAYLALLLMIVGVFTGEFLSLTQARPLAMGFAKFGLLATFGSLLKQRRRSGAWQVNRTLLPFQFTIWGLVGVWITLAFSGFYGLVDALVAGRLWPNLGPVWLAFSRSLWINLLGGFGFWMMSVHEYLDRLVEGWLKEKSLLSVPRFIDSLNKPAWFGFVLGTVVWFWLPAHTLTFLLPSQWRILFAAALSVALGFFTAVRGKK